jgi:hypothetical protein
MNILLWVIQAVIALFCCAGAAWRIGNYAGAAKQVPSVAALPYGAWLLLGAFEVLCAVGLVVPGLFKLKPQLTVLAAQGLGVEMLLVTGLHLYYFGLLLSPSNPALWSLALAGASAFVAYGRAALAPL